MDNQHKVIHVQHSRNFPQICCHGYLKDLYKFIHFITSAQIDMELKHYITLWILTMTVTYCIDNDMKEQNIQLLSNLLKDVEKL